MKYMYCGHPMQYIQKNDVIVQIYSKSIQYILIILYLFIFIIFWLEYAKLIFGMQKCIYM